MTEQSKKQRSAAVRDREVERFAAEIRRAPITASTTLTSGSGSLSSEADQDDDGNVEGIALQLRPTLPKKRLEIPRFSPTAAWRLLSALDSTSLAPPPPLGDAVDALEERITRLARPTAPPPAPQIAAAAAAVAARGSHDKSGDSGISGDASPVGGHEDSLDPPAHHNRKGMLTNKVSHFTSVATLTNFVKFNSIHVKFTGSCHKRQKPHAPTQQAPIRNRQTRKVANVKGLNRNTNLT